MRAPVPLAVAGLLLTGVAVARADTSVVIANGARVVQGPVVQVDVTVPPDAVALEVAAEPGFTAPERRPVASRIEVSLTPGGDGAERQVWVRAVDAAGVPIGAAGGDTVLLDDTPPALTGARVDLLAPVVVCAPGGPAVAGTSRTAVPARVEITARDGSPGVLRAQIAGGDWRPLRPAELPAAAGGTVPVRLRDRLGNTGPWLQVAVPDAAERVASAAALPFTAALECPGPSPAARTAAVRAAFARTGREPGDRAILRPPLSALDWTWYAGQGLQLNWVHAGTALNARLSREPIASYRAAVSEILAYSTPGRTPAGRRFRVNENRFTAPDDGHPPPWRDAMGTGVILALLAPAIAPDAPEGERDLARTVAAEYLETFSVPWSRGGVAWSGGGPGAWYLEYAYRTRARILNGFLQSVLSLSRFERQARRLAARDPAWAPSAARARERVLAGATAASRRLPAYDLGGGATRYSLTSGPASAEYRRYHVLLLGALARVPYVPAAQRAVFRRYAAAWS